MIHTSLVQTGNLVFDLLTDGDKVNGIPVMLLHGFPETNQMWVPLMEELSEKGYYCVAPNLRGYSVGARPAGKKNYQINLLKEDILQLSIVLRLKNFHLIGHDWGAVIGWQFTAAHREQLLSWTALSVPHTKAFSEAIISDPVQQKMSAYIRRFQWPWLPEYLIRKNDFGLFRKLWKYCNIEEVEANLKVFRKPGALTATLGYYRANYGYLKQKDHALLPGNIQTPTLFIWGEKDFAIGPYGTQKCAEHITGPYTFLTLDAGHWLIQTNYAEVSKAILDHIQKNNLNNSQ